MENGAGYSWFAASEPITERFYAPGAHEVANQLRERGGTPEEVKALLEHYSFEATLTERTGADEAQLAEFRVNEGGQVGIDWQGIRAATIMTCLVGWTLPQPPSVHAIKALPEQVQVALQNAIPDRTLTLEEYDARRGANGSGPPTPPESVPAAVPEKDTAQKS